MLLVLLYGLLFLVSVVLLVLCVKKSRVVLWVVSFAYDIIACVAAFKIAGYFDALPNGILGTVHAVEIYSSLVAGGGFVCMVFINFFALMWRISKMEDKG